MLTQNEADKEDKVNPVQDSQLEAQREVSAHSSYPQDATLSSVPLMTENDGILSTSCLTYFFLQESIPFPVGRRLRPRIL